MKTLTLIIPTLLIFFSGCSNQLPHHSSYYKYEFPGEVFKGEEYRYQFSDKYIFFLNPLKSGEGWEIVIKQKKTEDGDNLARLTPPLYLTPNPRYIKGWHFRNSDNTGPNETGEKNVNAPGKIREFIFSPKVGKLIQSEPTVEEVKIIRQDGAGTLTIIELELGNLKQGEKAYIKSMKFEVKIKSNQ